MRITTLWIGIQVCFTSILLANTLKAQGIRIDMPQASVKEVFNNIEKQANVSFVYDDRILDGLDKINVKAINKSLPDVLKIISAQVPLQFHQSGKVIGVLRILKSDKRDERNSPGKTDPMPPGKIVGKVVDEKGVPLVGATIQVKFTNNYAGTNEQGAFSLNVATDSVTIIVSYIGYKKKEIILVNNGLPVIVSLEPDNSVLKEVVVATGYQEIPLERATGSFSFVDKPALDRKVATDIISKLEGITSGLVFNVNPDGTKELGVRNRSTIFGYSQPLIVVDNFPYDGDINNINPNDVVSVTVLKDAAAASIWGVRAGNGVIVITTRRGRLNEPMHIEVNSSVTVSGKPNLFYDPNFLDATDFINVEKTLFNQGFYNADLSDPSQPPISPVVNLLNQAANGAITQQAANAQINALSNYDVRNDLQKYFYRNAVDQQYNVNITGGSKSATYMFSAGYDKNLPMQDGSEYDRITLNSQNTFTVAKGLLVTAGLNLTQENTTTNNAPGEIQTGGPYGKRIYPYAQLADADGNPLPIVKDYNPVFVTAAPGEGLLNWQFLPLEELRNKNNISTNDNYDMRVNAGINYKIIKGLNVDIKYQYERALAPNQTLNDADSYYARNMVNEYSTVTNGSVSAMGIPAGGILLTGNNNLSSQNLRGQLNYAADWGRNEINIIAGSEARQIQVSGNGNIEYGYDKSTGNYQPVDFLDQFQLYPSGNYATIINPPSNTGTFNRYRSYFANGSYTYDQRYTFSASGRIDQSNLFGVTANLRSVPLWSAGFKWNIDREKFYNLQWLPTLKLRATYGYNGNVDNSLAAVTTFMYAQGVSLTNANYAVINNPPNPNLRWEKDGLLNLGIDFGVKGNILYGSIEYYSKKATDLIGDASLAPSTGYPGPDLSYDYRGNFAAMSGNGIDVELNSLNINKAFKWTTHFLFSYATDKVTKYNQTISPVKYLSADGISGPGSIYPMIGNPVYGVYSYKWGGLDSKTGAPMGYVNGQVSEDYTNLVNPSSASDLVYNGPARPTMYGGMGNTFSYKHFSLTANISYKLGYYFRRPSINYSTLFNSYVGNMDFTKRWQQPGDENKTVVPSMPAVANAQRDQFYSYSSVLVDKGDHVRLQDVSLSYDFDKRNFPRMPFSHVQLYLYANNLGIIWAANKDHLDPDYPRGGIPAPHSISIGLKAGF